jgi:hypothetical protein
MVIPYAVSTFGWVLIGLAFLAIWIALAPASPRSPSQGPPLHRLLHLQPVLLPPRVDYRASDS